MKQPKRLTRSQKEALSAYYLPTKEYSLVEETEFYLKVIHRATGKTKLIDKYARRR